MSEFTAKNPYFIRKLADDAENSTSRDSNNVVDDLVNLSVSDFQNETTTSNTQIWSKYLQIIFKEIEPKFNESDHLILTSRSDIYYLQHALQYITELPDADLELYIWWALIEELVLHTTTDIRKMYYDYMKTVTELETELPRSFYCSALVNQLMGMAVSYAIVEADFLEKTKPKVLTMIQNIREAFDSLVQQADWMDSGTKCSTLEKSHAMKSLVGFPDWLLKPDKLDEYYAGLSFHSKTHLVKIILVLDWQMREKLRSLYSTEDIEWATTPTNVNAFLSSECNK